MTFSDLAFYAFAFVLLASAVLVVSSRNAVHSVLFLILAFINAAALFLLLGAEFLAMILIIVYVGAVAVLFLFVVMMLDVNFTRLREGFLQYLPVGALIGLVLLAELVFAVGAWQLTPEVASAGDLPMASMTATTNTEALGDVLYTRYIYAFQGAGLVLLVAMIGAIVLTLRRRVDVKRQDITRQVHRTAKDAIEVRKVKPGQGL